jgi:hypothetical protein
MIGSLAECLEISPFDSKYISANEEYTKRAANHMTDKNMQETKPEWRPAFYEIHNYVRRRLLGPWPFILGIAIPTYIVIATLVSNMSSLTEARYIALVILAVLSIAAGFSVPGAISIMTLSGIAWKIVQPTAKHLQEKYDDDTIDEICEMAQNEQAAIQVSLGLTSTVWVLLVAAVVVPLSAEIRLFVIAIGLAVFLSLIVATQYLLANAIILQAVAVGRAMKKVEKTFISDSPLLRGFRHKENNGDKQKL